MVVAVRADRVGEVGDADAEQAAAVVEAAGTPVAAPRPPRVASAVAAAANGTLELGVPVEQSFGQGMSFSVVPTNLVTDGEDNDGDLYVVDLDGEIFRLGRVSPPLLCASCSSCR